MASIGELQVPLQELKTKEAVDHVGHFQPQEPQKELLKLNTEIFQTILNNNQLIVVDQKDSNVKDAMEHGQNGLLTIFQIQVLLLKQLILTLERLEPVKQQLEIKFLLLQVIIF